MRVFIALMVVMVLAGCASSAVTPETPKRSSEPEVVVPNQRRNLSDWLGQDPNLEELRVERARAMLDPNKPITIDFVGKNIVVQTGAGDLSYNPELRRMGMRIGSDGQPKRFSGDGEVRSSWEELRAAQGFGR